MKPESTSVGTRRFLLALILLGGLAIRVWYASYDLEGRRFWDERYSLENVQSILDTGSLEPAKAYYPSPLVSWPQAGALAASDKLYRLTGREAFAIRSGSYYSATTYLLVRMFSVLYGCAGLLVLYLVGRRLGSAEVGLVAACALAFAPWLVRQSGVFKPDSLLILTVLLALHWSLGAVREPRPGNHLLAAFGIALALSAKITGGLVAISLAAGTLAMGWKDRRRWLLLALAALASLAFFFAMNPYGARYLAYTAHLQDDYAMRAEAKDMARWEIPLRVVGLLSGPFVHGPWYGALAALGVLAALTILLRRGGEPLRRAHALMLLAFPAVYVLAYALVTPHFKGNNFLPLVPFTALLGAGVIVVVWRWARDRLPGLRGPLPTALACGLLVAALAVPGISFVYRSLTPTTMDAARERLLGSLGADRRRYVFLEPAPIPGPEWERNSYFVARKTAAVHETGAFDRTLAGRLNRADGEIFPHGRIEGERSLFYGRRLGRADPERVRIVKPRTFRRRGPAFVAISHPWSPAGEPARASGRRCRERRDCVEFVLDGIVERGQVISVSLVFPSRYLRPRGAGFEIVAGADRLLEWKTGREKGERTHATERIRYQGETLQVSFTGVEDPIEPRKLRVDVLPWRREAQNNGG